MAGPSRLSITSLNSNDSQPKRGRPTTGSEPLERINVMLDSDTREGLKSLGGGNLSAGIRQAWQMLKAIMPLRRK
jgi:hypothetical protein